jgi:hypothetical protein
MDPRETFHPARVTGFLLGLLTAAGAIGMGIDLHHQDRLRAAYQGQASVSYPGP